MITAMAEPLTKSARTRQRILDAAAKVFREQGYAHARLSDIAVADCDAFDSSGAINDQRFTDREHQFPR